MPGALTSAHREDTRDSLSAVDILRCRVDAAGLTAHGEVADRLYEESLTRWVNDIDKADSHGYNLQEPKVPKDCQ